jgi:deoxyribonuclease-4
VREDLFLLIGAHESIAGGFHRAIHRAVEDGCRSVQIFTCPPGRWAAPPLKPEAVRYFLSALEDSGILSVLVHARYLINLAGADPDLRARSMTALREEYERSGLLGADGLVVHPGSHGRSGQTDGIRRASEMIGCLLDGTKEGPLLLLENTAGSGSVLGADFSQLAAIREGTPGADRIAYCFDTAHAFAAGFDLRGKGAVHRLLKRVDNELGLENVKAVHLNDSKKELGSRVDRHARIGEGFIGSNAFKVLLDRDEFALTPGILETEPLPDSEGRYRPQVQLLSSLGKAG